MAYANNTIEQNNDFNSKFYNSYLVLYIDYYSHDVHQTKEGNLYTSADYDDSGLFGL